MAVLAVLLVLPLLALLGDAWQARRLTRQLNSGTARALRCWLRGWSEPYPGAPHRGRLVAVDGEPIRFECRTGRVRRLLLPAGGLRVMQVREVADEDKLMPLMPGRTDQFTLLVCRDASGVRVDIAVPAPATPAAEAFVRGTATAIGPGSAAAPRRVGRVRQFVGRWTAAVLLTSGVLAVVNVWSWADAERITGTVASSVPNADGQGYLCTVDWRDPWTSAAKVSTIACPSRRSPGESIEAVARPDRDLAPPGGPYLGLILTGVLAFMAFPQVVRRIALHWRGRAVLRQRRGTDAETSGWRSSPRLEIGELDLDTVAEVVTIRARLEGWHYPAGPRRPRHTVRAEAPLPWWRIRFLRRRLLTPTGLGIVSFVVMAAGLAIGVPLWQTAAAQAGGPLRQVTATVEATPDGVRIPLLPVAVTVAFAGPDGPVHATVAADEPLAAGSPVRVRYVIDDPGAARIADDRDALGQGVAATAALGGLGAAVWIAGWVVAIRRVRRLAAALADPDPRRMRYALVTGPRGDLTALLYPMRGRPEQPVLSQPLAVTLPDTVALSGVADLHDAGRYGQLLVVEDLVLWPAGPTRPATPAATLDLVNGRR